MTPPLRYRIRPEALTVVVGATDSVQRRLNR